MAVPQAVTDWCKEQALMQTLTEWGSLSYEEVIDSLNADSDTYNTNDSIVVWQPFEDQWGRFLAEQIQALFDSFIDCAEFARKEH